MKALQNHITNAPDPINIIDTIPMYDTLYTPSEHDRFSTTTSDHTHSTTTTKDSNILPIDSDLELPTTASSTNKTQDHPKMSPQPNQNEKKTTSNSS